MKKSFCFGVRFFISYCRYNNFQFDAYSKPSVGSDLVSYFVFKKVYLDVTRTTNVVRNAGRFRYTLKLSLNFFLINELIN